MILLDTNVVSEPLRKMPEPQVVEWLNAQALETLYLSAVTVAELRFGIACLPASKRRELLNHELESKILPLFIGRVLAFDIHTTLSYAHKLANARKTGLAVGTADGYIAAIAAAHHLAIATRDTAPFEAMGLSVINPWL